MGRHSPDFGSASLEKNFSSRDDGSAGIDHVVGQDAQTALYIADDFFCFDDICLTLRTTFVDKRDVGLTVVKVLSHTLCNLDTTRVRRHDHRSVGGVLADVVLENGCGGEMVNRTIEKPLDLSGVKVDGNETICARKFEHVGYESRRHGFAPFCFAVLARVTVKRTYRSDALCRRSGCSVDHCELFHDGVVHRTAIDAVMALHDEHVSSTNTLRETWPDFTVRELGDVGVA